MAEKKLQHSASQIDAAISKVVTNEGNISQLSGKVGDISALQTSAKTDLVSAINETVSKENSNTTNLTSLAQKVGSVESLQTTNKSSIVAAINEVKQSETTGGVTIVDNLESDSATSALSAKQGKVLAEKLDNKVSFDNNITAPTRLIRIDVTLNEGETLLTTKDEDNPILAYGKVKLNFDGITLNKYCTLEVQGATSALYVKKNFTIGFFSDAEYSESYKFRINNMVEHDEYVFKANFIDATQSRNIVSNRIWEQIVQCREGFPKRETESAYNANETDVYKRFDTGALGHVDGFPCVLYVDGEFYGIGTFNIGKKPKNYNLDKNNQSHIMMTAENHVNFNSYVTSDWEIKNPKTPDTSFTTKIGSWFSSNALTGDAFKNSFETYHNLQNAVDYYLFVNFLFATDCVYKNFILTSWDGVKYSFMPYDLDTTFGLKWTGLSINPYDKSFAEYFSATTSPTGKSFWEKFYTAYSNEVNARYAQLRENGIFSVDNVYSLFSNFVKLFGYDYFGKEFTKYNIPSNSDNVTTPYGTGGCRTSIPQVCDWIKNRIEYLDNEFEYNVIQLESISIVAEDSYEGAEAVLSASYTPSNTTQRGITWSIVSGSEYASIDSSTGSLTIKEGASASNVIVKCTSTKNNNISGTKTISVTYIGETPTETLIYELNKTFNGSEAILMDSNIMDGGTSEWCMMIEYNYSSIITDTRVLAGTAASDKNWRGIYIGVDSAKSVRYMNKLASSGEVVTSLSKTGKIAIKQQAGQIYHNIGSGWVLDGNSFDISPRVVSFGGSNIASQYVPNGTTINVKIYSDADKDVSEFFA